MQEVNQQLWDLAVENVSKQQEVAFVSDKLANLKQMVEEPSKQEITMVYLDEESALNRVALPIEGDEPTEDDWVKLLEKADGESWRVFGVLSVDGSDGRVIIADGPVVVGMPDDSTLREALRLADGNREYYLSARR
jgi:hypothetical protein